MKHKGKGKRKKLTVIGPHLGHKMHGKHKGGHKGGRRKRA